MSSARIKLLAEDIARERDRINNDKPPGYFYRPATQTLLDLLDLAEEALKARGLLTRTRDALRRSATNEALTIDHLRGFMLGVADGVDDQMGDGT